MAYQAGKWWKALREFAADYLLPVGLMFVLVVVGLGVLGSLWALLLRAYCHPRFRGFGRFGANCAADG